ncbi:hypothetical protein O8W32_06670 [Methanomassiliicoccales archaeon LGM-DZ1]|nr:hypothetical protein O8W32_06670 [Methanomassiliicoccales archaeon LGM-DZ1]
MASEWEDLEKLTKEELVIELVRARACYRGLRGEIDKKDIWPWPEDLSGPEHREGPGKATPGWAEKIALYGAMHPEDGTFYWCDLENYGLDRDTAYEVCGKLMRDGRLKTPEGVDIMDPEEGDL